MERSKFGIIFILRSLEVLELIGAIEMVKFNRETYTCAYSGLKLLTEMVHNSLGKWNVDFDFVLTGHKTKLLKNDGTIKPLSDNWKPVVL